MPPVFSFQSERLRMLKTNAAIRRFLAYQRQANPKPFFRAWQAYENYVYCVADTETPKSFEEWITS